MGTCRERRRPALAVSSGGRFKELAGLTWEIPLSATRQNRPRAFVD